MARINSATNQKHLSKISTESVIRPSSFTNQSIYQNNKHFETNQNYENISSQSDRNISKKNIQNDEKIKLNLADYNHQRKQPNQLSKTLTNSNEMLNNNNNNGLEFEENLNVQNKIEQNNSSLTNKSNVELKQQIEQIEM